MVSLKSLHYVARCGHVVVVICLFGPPGEDAEEGEPDGCTSLQTTSDQEYFGVGGVRPRRCIDVNTTSAGGRSPLHDVADLRSHVIAQLLIERGAIIDAKDAGDGSTLPGAARIWKTEMPRSLP